MFPNGQGRSFSYGPLGAGEYEVGQVRGASCAQRLLAGGDHGPGWVVHRAVSDLYPGWSFWSDVFLGPDAERFEVCEEDWQLVEEFATRLASHQVPANDMR